MKKCKTMVLLIMMNFCVCMNSIVFTACGSAVFKRENSIETDTYESEEVEASIESEIESPDNSESQQCIIALDNLYPVFYDDNDIEISLLGCEYTQDASDIRIALSVNNSSNSLISVTFNDIKVDNVPLRMLLGNSETYKVGQVGSNFYIMLEDLVSAQCTVFDKITCTISGSKASGENLFEYNLDILREAFVPYTSY